MILDKGNEPPAYQPSARIGVRHSEQYGEAALIKGSKQFLYLPLRPLELQGDRVIGDQEKLVGQLDAVLGSKAVAIQQVNLLVNVQAQGAGDGDAPRFFTHLDHSLGIGFCTGEMQVAQLG